ncbi:protein of unknown function (DUF4378) [Castilleja foliolosa]|uniref:DUF4378 domain-containing protein n=1 Tax=Castilleja foliolosa TaxID=1961234 RepID=A0ABD3DQI1_9LAMI
MSAKKMPCDTYENRNLRKQIGCMKGIFQLFDRQHFLTSSNKHKRLLLGGQHQLESNNATNATTDKQIEVQNQKPRISTESSQAASYLSSSSSSTFSLLDHNRANISEGPFHIIPTKQKPNKDPQSPHIRDVVKDSMHREARGVPIKSRKNDEQKKATVMKHIDSPRLLHKPRFDEETNRVFSRDERLTLRRLSYDGRESRDALRTKHKELPRLSLDGKASSIKCSGLDSRSDFSGQESGGHSRTSSIVAKLMGLDDFPDTVTSADYSNCRTPSLGPGSNIDFPSNSKLIISSRQALEPAPVKQVQDPKSSNNTQNSPSSVYAEMEKRINELEFKRSGKDLRALKQILESMQKTRDKLENESHEPQMQNQMCSSHRITKSAKATEKVKFPKSGKVPTVEKMHRSREKKKELNDMKEPIHSFSSINKKTNQRNSEPERIIRVPPQRMRVFETASPKSQHNALSPQGRAHKHLSKKVGENCSLDRKTNVNKSMGFELSDDGLSKLISEARYASYQDDTASVKSEATSSAKTTNPNYRVKQNYISTSKEHMPEVEVTVTLIEQPSPVSVLDTNFFIEELPSPVKTISTVFQDVSTRLDDEAEWPLENLNHFTQPSPVYKYKAAVNHNESECRGLIQDQEYIDKILAASGLFKDMRIAPTANPIINPGIFHVLEDENRALIKKNELNQKMQRRVVFDTVNEILVHRITAVERGKRTSPHGIMREFYMEMYYLSSMAYQHLEDDEDDGSIRLITADMKYRSDEWADYGDEVPAMMLEIERLIFKDLVNEVVNSQVKGFHDWPKKHCRQLFTK